MTTPPPRVLRAFAPGAESAAVQPLGGGQGGAWRAGDVVLKPLDMAPEALAWQAEVLGALRPDGVRVASPLRAGDGSLVVDGWTAWPVLAGRPEPRWPQIAAVGAKLHRALTALPRPDAVLDAREDWWAVADRVAWEELPSEPFAADEAVRQLAAARAPVAAPSQLIHGDLTGNVLFADGMAPAVIDLAPYWRPAAYATAIVAADALVFHDAEEALLDALPADPELPQLLVRALLFRRIVALLAGQRSAVLDAAFARAVAIALRRAARAQ